MSSTEETPTGFLARVRAATSVPGIVIQAVVAVLVVVGVVVSIGDPEGDIPLGAAMIVGPAVVSAYTALEMLWWRRGRDILFRVLHACLLVQIPTVVVATVVSSVLTAMPFAQRMFAEQGFNYWWDGSTGPMAGLLTLFAGYGIAGFAGIMAILIVCLPGLALLQARDVARGGADVDRTGLVPGGRSSRGVVLVAFAVSSCILGICLWVFGQSESYADGIAGAVAQLPWLFDEIRRDTALASLSWLAGIALVGASVVLVVAGVVATRRAASDAEGGAGRPSD